MGVWVTWMSQVHLKEPEWEATMFRGGPANLYLSIWSLTYSLKSLYSSPSLFCYPLALSSPSVTDNKKPRCAHRLHNEQCWREIDNVLIEGTFLQRSASAYWCSGWVWAPLLMCTWRTLCTMVKHKGSKGRQLGFEAQLPQLHNQQNNARRVFSDLSVSISFAKRGTRRWGCCGPWSDLEPVKPLCLAPVTSKYEL